jgi:AcrR family transcriptional regulator
MSSVDAARAATAPSGDSASVADAPDAAVAAGDRPKLRADAVRNRALLLDAAREAFEAADGRTPVSLEAIAKAAGVGIGTLYRNFPTREALVEALHASELDEVVASAGPLLEGRTAFDALRLWMDRYSRFVATKQGMADALVAALASGAIRRSETRERITAAIGGMLAAGAADGTIRPDVDPGDLTAMLVGVFVAAGDAKDTERVARMRDLLMDGLRPRPAADPPRG